MPIRPSKGVKMVALEVAPEVIEQMKALAESNGRSFAAEVRHAFLRHLASPPVVRVETPPLADVEAPVAVKRGRPGKGQGGSQ